jgi:integrase
MESTEQPGSDGEIPSFDAAIDQFISAGDKSGNYRANCRYVLDEFVRHLRNRGITTISKLSPKALAHYASTLNDDDDLADSTVWTYYDTVSAFLEYADRWEWVDDNFAHTEIAKNELPKRPSPDSSEQQFWTPEYRKRLLNHVDRVTATAVDDKGLQAHVELRNKVLVYLLAYSGVRAGEILSDPRDDRRNGMTWGDIDMDAGVITVLGKDQKRETVPLPSKAHHPLSQLNRAVSPPSDDWPVIFTDHNPTLYGCLPDGFDPDSCDGETALDYCKIAGVEPPALSTNGARSVLKRLCEAADIEIDGEYLKPHGGRRGVGERLFRDKGSATAQRVLRHSDPRTTSEMYSHIESSELVDDVDDAFDGE